MRGESESARYSTLLMLLQDESRRWYVAAILLELAYCLRYDATRDP